MPGDGDAPAQQGEGRVATTPTAMLERRACWATSDGRRSAPLMGDV